MSSKTAVWRAVNSIHGDRLVEIAREHSRLAKEIIGQPHSIDAEIIESRIQALRSERDAIIELFEEGGETNEETGAALGRTQ